MNSETKNILVVIVGLPRSGKSTWAKTRKQPIVNPDSIRLALHGERFIGQAEPWIWVIAKTMVEALFLAGHNIVIVDGTHVTKKRRDFWESDKWERIFHYVPTSAEECIKRAKDMNDDYIIPVIERMAENYEPIGEEERQHGDIII